jgi:hypothetical protein
MLLITAIQLLYFVKRLQALVIFKLRLIEIGSQPLNGQFDAQIKTSVSVYPHKETDGEVVPAWIAFDRKVMKSF